MHRLRIAGRGAELSANRACIRQPMPMGGRQANHQQRTYEATALRHQEYREINTGQWWFAGLRSETLGVNTIAIKRSRELEASIHSYQHSLSSDLLFHGH